MPSLYELGEDLANAVYRINEKLENGMSPDDPEIQADLKAMVTSEGDWKEKAIRVGKYIRQCKAEAGMIKEESKHLAEKAKRHEKQAEQLTALLKQQMETFGVEVIEDPICPIKLRQNNWSVVVESPDGLPIQYQREVKSIEADKKALLEARLTCGGLPGVTFTRTTRLAIG